MQKKVNGPLATLGKTPQQMERSADGINVDIGVFNKMNVKVRWWWWCSAREPTA